MQFAGEADVLRPKRNRQQDSQSYEVVAEGGGRGRGGFSKFKEETQQFGTLSAIFEGGAQ